MIIFNCYNVTCPQFVAFESSFDQFLARRERIPMSFAAVNSFDGFRWASLALLGSVLGAISLSQTVVAQESEPVGQNKVDFARQILPILSNKCFVCHGPDGTDKDVLRLDSLEEATRDLGGYRAVDPEKPGGSEVLVRIHSTDDPMPPEDAEKQLEPEERELLTRWVRQGGSYARHWSFVSPEKRTPPGFDSGDRRLETLVGIIDRFVAEQLHDRKIDFAPEADRPTLARRVALVLTGLPPEPSDLARFVADPRPDAYARFVEQQLANRRFGEHQGRYWLDAVRYGDTHGLHLDNRRAIYPYRDWVIDSLNRNLPLDQFLIWQLAGDLLPDPTLEQRVATGFVRMNPSTAEGGVIPAEFQAKNNFDRVETLGTVLLGMSLICSRCHSHKYDPIPQSEYYHLMAFFNSTAEEPLDGNKYEYGPVIKAPANLVDWGKWRELESTKTEIVDQAEEGLSDLESVDASLTSRWESLDVGGRFALVAGQESPFAGTQLHTRAQQLAQQITELEATFVTTLVAQELPEPRATHLLHRGEYDQPHGDPLQPNVLTVMGGYPQDAPRNRLGLSQWLTSRTHPLVARVLVNRIWQRTFGFGLVRTPEDFGLQGQQPTHPQLLDWLAVELHDSGWDLKHMLRLMVHTRTFRQQSAWRTDVEDPENRLLARGPRHRLDAEVIRDIALWSSGLLDGSMGGEGVKPYQPSGLWSALMHPGSNTKEYKRDEGDLLYRRSIYVYWKRTCPHPMLTLFDGPSRESSCVRRSRTNTSLQSLGLLNETQRTEAARTLAARLLREAPDDDARCERMFHLLASRLPTDMERSVCLKLLENMRQRYRVAIEDAQLLVRVGEAAPAEDLDAAEHAAWTQVAATVLASDVAILLY